MTEAEKYTTEMWQRHLLSMVSVISSPSEERRNAFLKGAVGAMNIYDAHRSAWLLGRQTAVLLGYIEADAEKSDG